MQKMKVLFISHENDLNGSGRSMLSLMDKLKDRVTFYLLTPDTSGALLNEAETLGVKVLQKQYYRWVFVKYNDEKWEYWKQRWNATHDFKNELVARELAEYVVKEHIDIIHTNVGVVDIGARIKKYSNVKHIWHFREFADLDFNMYPLVPRDTYEKMINLYSDKCLFVSNAVMNHYGFIDTKKKQLIYNGIEDKGPIEHVEEDSVNILIAGVVSEAKGQFIAARACSELIDEGYNIKLYIAGNCDKQSEAELLKICNTGLVMCGFVTDMQTIWRKINIQLVCSRCEGFGRTTVEAMLLGIPVIGSKSGGTPEIIPDENAGGILFEPGNYLDLKEKIKYLYDSPERRRMIGKKGRDRALELFSLDSCADNVWKTYLNLL